MNIAIIDDHVLVRSCIAGMLLGDLDLIDEVVEADNAKELYQKDSNKHYSLILLDYHIPGQNPDETFRSIIKYFPSVPIIYISSDEKPEIILATINNGAAGYVVKSADMELFKAVINLVLSGGKYIPVELLAKMRLSQLEASKLLVSDKLIHLSKRQKQVFDLLLQQYSNKNIAEVLNISEHTVKSHINRIYNLLGLKTRQDVFDRFKAD